MATTEKMTVHKLLSELKIMEKRIHDAIHRGQYCIANKHSNTKISGISIEEYKSKMQGDYDKATALIERYFAMKKALTLSNAVTTVTIAGTDYTIAEAIAMKNYGTQYQSRLVNELRSQYAREQAVLETKNGDELERKADKYIIDLYGNSEDTRKGEAATQARSQYVAQNSYDFIDAIGIVDKIARLEEKIDSFTSEVDAALSCSNALTIVEFSY